MANITEVRLDEAHARMEAADDWRAKDLPFYISHDEHPVEALKKIRACLYGYMGDSQTLALAVAGMDRVIDQLDRFKLRRIFEEL